MALKAGYRGVKKSFLDIINSIKLITSIGDGLDFDSGELSIEAGDGISFDEDGKVTANLGDGLDFDEDGKVTADLGDGLDFDQDGKIIVSQPGSAYTLEQIYYNNGDPATMSTDVSITEGKHFSDYDAILIGYGQPSDGGISASISHRTIFITDPVFVAVKRVSFGDYGQRSMSVSFDFTNDTFNYVGTANNEQAGYKPSIYELCGIKF